MEALGRVPGVGMDEMTFRDPFEAPDALYVEKSCCSVCQASVDATVIAALSCKPILRCCGMDALVIETTKKIKA